MRVFKEAFSEWQSVRVKGEESEEVWEKLE